MRLIRLTSSNPNAIFDNNFNADIKVNPKSKVALKSLSLEVALSEIEVNTNNDTINFQVSGTSGIQNAVLDHNTYDNINFQTLLNDMNTKMNAELTTTGINDTRMFGLEIKNEINSGSTTFESMFRQSGLQESTGKQVRNKATNPITRTAGGGADRNYYEGGKAVGSADDSSVMYYPEYISKGGGIWRLQLRDASDGTDNIVFGLSTANLDNVDFTGGLLPTANINYAIHLETTGVAYNYIKDGITTAPLVAQIPNIVGANNPDNDFLEIAISGGHIEGRVYNHTIANPVIIFREVYNNMNTTQLYPFVSIRGATPNTSIKYVKTTLSFFNNPTQSITDFINYEYEDHQVHTIMANPPQPARGNSNHFLEFEGESLASYLGFTYPRVPPNPGTFVLTNNFTAVADDIFRPNNLSDSFVVETLTGLVPLKSYDGETSQRRNILSVVPVSDNNGSVVYEVGNPIFIDLDNVNPISIRNITARVLFNDLSPVKMAGLGTIVVLIKDENEIA